MAIENSITYEAELTLHTFVNTIISPNQVIGILNENISFPATAAGLITETTSRISRLFAYDTNGTKILPTINTNDITGQITN